VFASGYFIGPGFSYTRRTTLEVIIPNATSVDFLRDRLQPILDEVKIMTKGNVISRGNYTLYPTYGDYLFPPKKSAKPDVLKPAILKPDDTSWFPGQGRSKLLTSWLWNEKALQHPDLRSALQNSVDNGTLMWSDFTAGPGTHNPPHIRGGGNAVNPAWRSAIVRPCSEMDWDAGDPSKLVERLETLKTFGTSLRSLDLSSGTYFNEADVQTVDYAHVFWGNNYPRLLEIKKNRDPDGLFWCRACVGSELWEESTEGELCRRK